MTDVSPERAKQDEILRGALMKITLNPETWVQSTWLEPATSYNLHLQPASAAECGTVGCLAGWMVHDAGIAHFTREEVCTVNWEAVARLDVPTVGLERDLDFQDVAAYLAGLTSRQADSLFAGGNDLRRLWELTELYTDGRVSLPEELAARVTEIDGAGGDDGGDTPTADA